LGSKGGGKGVGKGTGKGTGKGDGKGSVKDKEDGKGGKTIRPNVFAVANLRRRG
jgi:hypothetical protein